MLLRTSTSFGCLGCCCMIDTRASCCTPVPIIQRQLGHASLATTDRYLQSIAPADVIATMQRREWLHMNPGDDSARA